MVSGGRRFASPFSGPVGLRTQMRHILYANRKRRLRKLAGSGAIEPDPNFDPIAYLGTDLYEAWDANRLDTIETLTDATYTNAVAHWYGLVNGYDLAQSTPLLKPTYDSDAFGGSPCIKFDGIQQYLTCTDAGLLAAIPDGAEAGELWVLCSQDALPADTTERYVAGWSGSSVVTGRAISRVVTTGVNRARGRTGIGASATSATGTVVDFSGIHVVRHIVGATTSSLEVDGNTKVDVAAVPATTNTRFRVGAISAAAASNWWQGKVAAVLITKPLTDQQALDLHAYFG